MATNTSSGETLCTYSIGTLPDPVQVSPKNGNNVYAAITFVVSNGSKEDIHIETLEFNLEPGTDSTELTSDPGAILYAANPEEKWDIVMSSAGLFTAQPSSGEPFVLSKESIVFQFFNIRVNQQTGTTLIGITETASSASNPLQARNRNKKVTKFPYGFFMSNFTPRVPMVDVGQPVTLTWEASDQAKYYKLYWDAHKPPQDVTNMRMWTVPAIYGDTTFLLRGTVIAPSGEEVDHDLYATVIVSNPDVTARSLSVSGASDLQGTVTAGGTLTAKTALVVEGMTNATAVTTTGDLAVGGTTTLNRLLTARAGTNTSDLTVTGKTSLAETVITGQLTAAGLAVNGPLSLFGNIHPITAGKYQANTDGFVTGAVLEPNNHLMTLCVGTISCYTSDNRYMLATGGNACYAYTKNGSDINWYVGNNPNSFTMPIKKDTSWVLSEESHSQDGSGTYNQFFWIPAGNMADSYTRLKDNAEIPGIPKMQPQAALFTSKESYTHEPQIDQLLDVLQDLFGEQFTPEKREKLRGAIKALVYVEGKKLVPLNIL